MEIIDQIKDKVRCCACEGTMADSVNMNIVTTSKVSTWKFPVSRNILIKNSPSMAVAIVCDNCIKEQKKIKNVTGIWPRHLATRNN